MKTIKILKIIRDASSLGENKEGNTQGMCFFREKIRDKNYQNSENNKGCLVFQIIRPLYTIMCVWDKSETLILKSEGKLWDIDIKYLMVSHLNRKGEPAFKWSPWTLFNLCK